MNTAIWFSFQLTENSSNWLLQLDLHLIWWKISWNWILQLDLHLIWRKIRIIECWNFMFLSINRKFVKLNTATWSAIDLTENFVKLNTATWFALMNLIWRNNSGIVLMPQCGKTRNSLSMKILFVKLTL